VRGGNTIRFTIKRKDRRGTGQAKERGGVNAKNQFQVITSAMLRGVLKNVVGTIREVRGDYDRGGVQFSNQSGGGR